MLRRFGVGFQPPPPRTERADFQHSALLPASRPSLWDVSRRALSILVLPNTYSTPRRPVPSSLGRIPPDFGSCRLLGVFIMRPCLPYRPGNCLAAGLLRSPDITPLLRYSEPIRHRLAVSHFPGFAGYMTYPAPPISRWDEDGFSSCLACPWSG